VESGIEGILNRLEKERNSTLGLGLREKEDRVSSGNSEVKDDNRHRSTTVSVSKFYFLKYICGSSDFVDIYVVCQYQ